MFYSSFGSLGLPIFEDLFASEPDPFMQRGVREVDVVTISTEAPRKRTAAELKDAIRRAGGVLVTGPNSSEFIVARNDRWQFKIVRDAQGNYQISEQILGGYLPYILGGGALIFLVTALRK